MQLVQTVSEFGNLASNLLLFLVQNLAVTLEEFNEISGSHIEDPLEFTFHFAGRVCRGCEVVSAKLSKSLLLIFRHINAVNVLFSHFDQGFLRPGHKPVNSGVVDQRGIVSGVIPETFSNRTHANGEMHVILHPIEEEFVELIWIINRQLLFQDTLHLISDSLEVISGVDIWHNTSIEHVLDVFEETLFKYIIIRENEHSLQFDCSWVASSIKGSQLVQIHKFSPEILQTEVFSNFKLINIHVRNVRSKSGERMSARSTHSDKKSMTSFQINNSVDLGNVDNGVRKQHYVHLLDSLLRIIGHQFLVEIFAKTLEVSNLFINSFVVIIVCSNEEINENGI